MPPMKWCLIHWLCSLSFCSGRGSKDFSLFFFLPFCNSSLTGWENISFKKGGGRWNCWLSSALSPLPVPWAGVGSTLNRQRPDSEPKHNFFFHFSFFSHKTFIAPRLLPCKSLSICLTPIREIGLEAIGILVCFELSRWFAASPIISSVPASVWQSGFTCIYPLKDSTQLSKDKCFTLWK